MKNCSTCGAELPDGVATCPTCGTPTGEPVIPANGTSSMAQSSTEPPRKKKLWPKILIAVIIIFVALFAISSCSNCSSNSNNAKPWPTGPLAQMIPSMNKQCENVFESEDSLSLTVSQNITKNDYDAYVNECKEWGYTIDSTENSEEYSAFNPEGYKLELDFRDFNGNEISIDLYTPRTTENLVWPTVGLATKIPNPNKEKGSIAVDSASQFTAYVGEMEKTDYDAYVKQCIEAGFDVDYNKDSNLFTAKNAQGDSLRLEYQGFNTMYISMHAAKDEDSSTSTPSSDSSSSSESVSSSSASSDSGLKTAMDEYESFIDGYIAFMKKYNNSSNTAGMASDYAKWMTDYADMTEKIDAIDENNLSASDLKYYNEVMARVTKKLADASLA